MINIAVIDDERDVLALIVGKIKSNVSGRNDIRVFSYNSAETFFDALKNKIRFQIVFSDIGMHGMNGLKLGQKLKSKWPNVYLIYLTSRTEFALESYQIEAYQYILKKDMNERLPDILQKVLSIVEKEMKTFLIVGTSADQKKINFEDILYIQKIKGTKYVEYITSDEALRDRKTMEQAMGEVAGLDFVLVERGHAVNMHHITRIRDNVITLSNGQEIIISRTRIAAVKEQVNSFWEM